MSLEDAIRTLLPDDEVYFVQIGSNDGIGNDPLRQIVIENEGWRGLFIEPVEYIFERLVQNYSDCGERLRFENVAIGPSGKSLPFYYLPENASTAFGQELPDYFDQLGSFDANHIVKHFGEKIRPFIQEKSLVCQSLETVLERNGIGKLDLIHIDTEGFDFEILKLIDFDWYQPKIILFEVVHLSPEDQQMAAKLLVHHGYKMSLSGFDVLAVRN